MLAFMVQFSLPLIGLVTIPVIPLTNPWQKQNTRILPRSCRQFNWVHQFAFLHLNTSLRTYRHQSLSTPGQPLSQAAGLFVHSLSSLLLVLLVHRYGSNTLCHGTCDPGGRTCYSTWKADKSLYSYFSKYVYLFYKKKTVFISLHFTELHFKFIAAATRDMKYWMRYRKIKYFDVSMYHSNKFQVSHVG